VRASRTARVAGAFVCAAALAGCGHAAPPAPDARRAGATSAPEKSDPMEHPSGLVFVGCGFLFVGNLGIRDPRRSRAPRREGGPRRLPERRDRRRRVTLAVPLWPGQDVTFAVGKAASAMQTIKRLPRPLDLVDVSEEVKRNPGRWPDCDR
jgi:hypothetical protein